MNPLLTHELARVAHAERVAALSRHRERSTLLRMLRRGRSVRTMAEMEREAVAPIAAAEVSLDTPPPWAW